MEGSPLREQFKRFVADTLSELQVTQNQQGNEQGTVTAVNDDGTVDVQTASGNYTGCGTPTQRVLGELVVVITADGQKVAI